MTEYETTRTHEWSFDERIPDSSESHRVLAITAAGIEWRQTANIFNQVGWTTWFRHDPGTFDQPEGGDIWASQFPERVLRSEKAERLFWFYRTGDGGMLKTIPVLPGQRVTFQAHAHAWSSNANDGRVSDGAGSAHVAWPEGSQPVTGDPWQDAKSNMTFKLGLALGSDINPLAEGVVWGPGFHIYNGYAPLSVSAVVPAGVTQITLIARGSARWALQHNDCYWDEFSATIETPVSGPAGPESGTKLGLHVLRNASGVPDFLSKRPAMVVLAGDWGLSEAIPEGTLVVGRVAHSSFDAQSLRKAGMTPAQAAKRLFDEDKSKYLDNPRISHWSGFNEPVWSTVEDMAWFAETEIERMRLLAGIGRRAVIGDFASGTPPMELWPAFLPAVRFALDNECLLGLHEYSTPWMWWMTGANQVNPAEDQGDEGWTTLRYRKVLRDVLIPAGLGAIRIAITECGLDPMVRPLPPGCPGGTWQQLGSFWKTHDGKSDAAAYYLEQLAWYDDELRADPQVAGAAVFCAGNFGSPWSDFDVAGSAVITGMTARVELLPPAPFTYEIPNIPLPEEPDPVARGNPRVQYERTYVLLPPNAPTSYWHAAVDAALDQRLTIGGSADDAGIGNLDVREIIAINALDWGDLANFYEVYYPGIDLVEMTAITDVELLLKLREWMRDIVPSSHIHVWQRNPLWAGINLGGPSGTETIGSDGCVLSCICMMLRDHFGYDARPDEMNGYFHRRGVFYNDDLLDWGKVGTLFEDLTFVRRADGAQSAATLAGLVNDPGNAVIVAVNSNAHFCYLRSVSGSTMTVYDPWYEAAPRSRPVSDCSGYRLYRITGEPEPEPPAMREIRGVHGAPITGAPSDPTFWINEMRAMGLTWYKSLCTQLDWNQRLLDAGIAPVVRLYKGQQFPGRLDAAQLEDARQLVDVGVRYFEIGNEPNLAGEWQSAYEARVDWHDTTLIRAVADAWQADAAAILALGGYPALYAMAPTERNGGTNPQYSSIEWLKRYLAAVDGADLRGQIAAGRVWLAVHASPFNRALEYDPYTNGSHPDDMCLRAVEVYAEIAQSVFGVIPRMISTEGGAYSPEHLAYLGWEPYSEADWTALMPRMFEFLERYPYLLGMCPWILTDEGVGDPRWKDNGWYRGRTARAVVGAMAAT